MTSPPLPTKKNYKDRYIYYKKICDSFHDFRKKHDLSEFELYAFLYDFAPKAIGGVERYIVSEIPEPKGAYLIGASKQDRFLFHEQNVITPWQCNPSTAVGDAIVMYMRSPLSAIDSIWRSVSVGFIDPFFFYYRCTYISYPEPIKKIPLPTMKQDEILSKLSIVRKNMQGVNGVELPPSAYNHILELGESKRNPLFHEIHTDYGGLTREKDVEDHLILPFLKNLGYEEGEYVRQLYIKVGHNHFSLIPDFVINPESQFGHHRGDFLIEAKYSIQNEATLELAKDQARSYARQLKCKYAVIASREKIWIMEEQDDYQRELCSYTWEELYQEDQFFSVYKFLGKERMRKSH